MSTRAARLALDRNAYVEILLGTPAGDRLRTLAGANAAGSSCSCPSSVS